MGLQKQKYTKAVLDSHAFKNLKTENMVVKEEHLEMLGNFMIKQGYKISKGKSDKTFKEVYEVLKETILQIKKLEQSYGL